MARTPSCDKNGLRKGTWTSEEDWKLIAYVTRYGCWNWRQLPKFAGLARCGKSCRLRWMNYLRPNLKRGNFTPEEEEIIIRMHKKLGNRWSVMAAELQGRTDNEVKNHWHTTLKKRVQVTNGEEAKASKLNDTTNIESSSTPGSRDSVPNINGSDVCQVTPPPPAATSQISDMTGPLSPLSSSTCEFTSITSSDHINASSNEKFVIELDAFTEPEMNESFWTEPYLADFTHTPGCASQNKDCQMIYDACVVVSPHQSNLVLDNDFGIFLDAYKEPTVDNFLTESYVADMSHVPSELLTPLLGESEYFSTVVYDTDLWS